jgi:hypothetical protein
MIGKYEILMIAIIAIRIMIKGKAARSVER